MADSTKNNSEELTQRWIFVAQALNQSGTLTAAASVFSNRGVSLGGILGSGIDTATAEDGRLLFSFHATGPKKDLLLRSLQRLPSIFKVTAYPYTDPRLRAVAVAKLTPNASYPQASLYTDVIAKTEDAILLLLSGGIVAVETAIAQLREQNQLLDVVVSTITL